MRVARVGDETRKVRCNESQLGPRDVGEPQEGTDERHVVCTVLLHAIPVGGVGGRRLHHAERGVGIGGRVELLGKPSNESRMALAQVSHVQLLGKRERAQDSVAAYLDT